MVGKGWTTVLVADLPADQQAAGGSTGGTTGATSPTAMLKAFPRVSGAWGSGHLLRTALLSAVLTDDGRVAVGAVPPQLLFHALSAR